MSINAERKSRIRCPVKNLAGRIGLKPNRLQEGGQNDLGIEQNRTRAQFLLEKWSSGEQDMTCFVWGWGGS